MIVALLLIAASTPPVPKAPYERLVSIDDYPAAARAQGLTGTARVRLDVAPTGRVTGCTILASSGTALLDAATCRLLSSRARFEPARDGAGKPVAGAVEVELPWSLPH
jgi:protein TonB